MRVIRSLALGLGLAAAALAAATPALAQDNFPSRPIKVLVGFSPGGGGDSLTRLMAEHMSRTLGQQVIVENRPGAGTTLAPAAAASAAPDGYTLALVPDSAFGADKVLWRPNVKYDETSFTPISRWARTFFILAANPKFGVHNAQDVIGKAKANKGEVFVASTQGLYPSMIISEFNELSGVRMTQVPYKGGAPSVMAAVSGDVPLTLSIPSSIMPMAADGKLVPVGITVAERSSLAAGVPTLDEQGLKGFNVGYWFALAGPAGLPHEVAQKLFDACAAALADPAVKKKILALGFEPAPSRSLDEFKAQALRDGLALKKTVERLGLKGG